jgi:hypothetical protein
MASGVEVANARIRVDEKFVLKDSLGIECNRSLQLRDRFFGTTVLLEPAALEGVRCVVRRGESDCALKVALDIGGSCSIALIGHRSVNNAQIDLEGGIVGA